MFEATTSWFPPTSLARTAGSSCPRLVSRPSLSRSAWAPIHWPSPISPSTTSPTPAATGTLYSPLAACRRLAVASYGHPFRRKPRRIAFCHLPTAGGQGLLKQHADVGEAGLGPSLLPQALLVRPLAALAFGASPFALPVLTMPRVSEPPPLLCAPAAFPRALHRRAVLRASDAPLLATPEAQMWAVPAAALLERHGVPVLLGRRQKASGRGLRRKGWP